MPRTIEIKRFVARQPLWRKGLALAVIALGAYFMFGRARTVNHGTTFVARRGPLEINVLVGGNTESLASQDIKCEVRGYQGVKILKIVEEGYQVTDDDVRTNKVLVELDSSELEKQITQVEIQYEQAVASLIDAQQAYKIQEDQNTSDIKTAAQKARFARMDFEKFMGDTSAKEIVDQLGIDLGPESPETNAVPNLASTEPSPTNSPDLNPASGAGASPVLLADARPTLAINLNTVADTTSRGLPQTLPSADSQRQTNLLSPAAPAATASAPRKYVRIDFSKYAKIELLGDGDAKQQIRKLEDDFGMAQKELGQAKTKLEGTQRLFTKGFVTKTDLDNDTIAYENYDLKVKTGKTAHDLYLRYDFRKLAEDFLSKYDEATRELNRTRKGAIAKMAQAEAKLKSAEAQKNMQERQRKDLYDQRDKCAIRAKKTGLVVYGSGNMSYYWGGQEQVREGALVREQQPIITIPDMTQMAVKVRIHESYIKKIKKGQKVRITLDAFADKQLEGEVSKVGVLPDSQNRWMNPDMNVYLTTININGVNPWLKPGMSAKVEILVDKLADVAYVPIQAVTPLDGKQYCYVVKGTRRERREVAVGQFNDEFIEITNGIKEGDKVCLQAPEAAPPEANEEGKSGPAKDKPANPAPAKPSSQPAPVTKPATDGGR
ncbi:MAG: efflux RND transporter periplasmic adaptor subunit [Limisphaerales bacterium]